MKIHPDREREIESIDIFPGETITIFLNRNSISVRDPIQIELRVTRGGKPEIFADLSKITMKDFADWESMEVQKP